MEFVSFVKTNAKWLSAGALLAFLSSFGQTFFISVFSEEIRTDLGLSHGQWGLYYTAGTMASAVVMVWAGALTDRYRVRDLGLLVLLLLVGACLVMANVPSAWAAPFAIFLLRFSGQGMVSHIASVSMARWFVAARGRALALSALGYSFGEALLPIVIVSLLSIVGWRMIWVGAALAILLLLPVLLWLLKTERTPQSQSAQSHAAGMGGRHWTRPEVLRTRAFWFAIPALLGPSAFVTAFFFHHAHFASTKGWSHVSFVALIPVYTSLAIGAMLLAGWAIDRFGAVRIMPLAQIIFVATFAAMGASDTLLAVGCAMALLGMGAGVNSTVPSAFWAEMFGTRHLGSIKAMATAIMVLGSALGPGITGVLIDFGISLPMQFTLIAVYFVFSAAMMVVSVRSLLTASP